MLTRAAGELVAGAVLLLCVPLALACGAGESSYIHKNEELLSSLPVYPGAQQLAVKSKHYDRADCEPPAPCLGGGGYITTGTYQSPAGASPKQVIDFYIERLTPEWVAKSSPVAGTNGYLATFEKDKARISLSAGKDVAGDSDNSFFLRVDHDALK